MDIVAMVSEDGVGELLLEYMLLLLLSEQTDILILQKALQLDPLFHRIVHGFSCWVDK